MSHGGQLSEPFTSGAVVANIRLGVPQDFMESHPHGIRFDLGVDSQRGRTDAGLKGFDR